MSVPTDTDKLCALVAGLHGHDIEKMSEGAALAFKADRMAEFRMATAGLPTLLLPACADFERLVWRVEAAEPYCLEWIGRFSLRATDLMEANLDRPRRIAAAAAMWPDVELMVDLLGDYHYAGGLSVEPALRITVRVDGAASEALERLSPEMCESLGAISLRQGFELRVRTAADAIEDQVNPRQLQGALAAARYAALSTADAEGHGLVEAIEIQLKLASLPGLIEQDLLEALTLMGRLFTHCDAVAAAI